MLVLSLGGIAAFVAPIRPVCASRPTILRSRQVSATTISPEDFDVRRGARELGGLAGAVAGNKMYNSINDLLHLPVATPSSAPSIQAHNLENMNASPDIASITTDIPSVSMAAPDLSGIKASDLSAIKAPDLSGIKTPDLFRFTAPDLSGFKPDLSGFKAPDFSEFSAPDLSRITPDFSNMKLPDLPSVPGLSALTSSIDSTLDAVSTSLVPPASASDLALSSMSALDHSAFLAVAEAGGGGGGLPWGFLVTIAFAALGAFGLDYCVTTEEPYGEGSGLIHSIAFQCGKYTDITTQKILLPASEKALLGIKQAIMGGKGLA